MVGWGNEGRGSGGERSQVGARLSERCGVEGLQGRWTCSTQMVVLKGKRFWSAAF